MTFYVGLYSLREKCPNTESYLIVFCPNAGKYELKKSPYLDTFHAVIISSKQNA